MATQASKGWDFHYTTRDVVIIAILAAVGGVISAPVGNVWYVANTSLGPMGGAFLQGTFIWNYVLAMALVRKPGAALITGVLTTLVEVVMGNQAGIGVLGWGVSQGLTVEVIMAFTGYTNYGLVTAIAAGAASSQFGTVWTAILYGWDPDTAATVWWAIPINLISGAIFSGLLVYYLASAIRRTGLVRSAQ